jgi:hypothetical protein
MGRDMAKVSELMGFFNYRLRPYQKEKMIELDKKKYDVKCMPY